MTRHTFPERSVYGFTPSYAPPEQMEGEKTDERSDLYALGVTLYALLIGKAPHDAYLRQKYIDDGYPDPLKPVNQLNSQVPPHVAQALQRATALEPAERPNSATQMRAMLHAPQTQPVGPLPPTIPPTSAQQPPRFTQTPSHSQPLPTPSAPVSSVSAGGGNRFALLFGLMVAFVLLLGAAYVYGRNSNGTPTLGAGATTIAQTDGMVQVYVPEGDFEMGSGDDDPDAFDDEKPRHTVYLDAFWIDQTEVTNAMFAEFVAKTEHQTDAEKEGSAWVLDGDSRNQVNGADWQHPQGPESNLDGLDDYPVIQVSWNDATAYCAWAERRLPTEAEWEKAAGGILTKEEARKYPWGNDAPTGARLNFCDQNCTQDNKDSSTNDGYKRTSPVGNYPAGASPYGALDMASNVWEWVSDFYDSNYYASSPRQNPTGPSPSSGKAHRGGSWYDSAPTARVHNRNEVGADFRDEVAGFRCARSP